MSENFELNSGKFFLILDRTLMQFYREPRSKKRRILKKWRERAENYRPHPMVFEQRVMMGCEAIQDREAYEKAQKFPVVMMHPDTYERAKKKNPEFWARAMVREDHGYLGGARIKFR